VQSAIIDAWLLFGLEGPAVFGCIHGVGERGRHLYENASVATTGFYQQHSMFTAFGQAVSQYTTGGACADDNVILALLRHGKTPKVIAHTSAQVKSAIGGVARPAAILAAGGGRGLLIRRYDP
jgi:hypothetical protein